MTTKEAKDIIETRKLRREEDAKMLIVDKMRRVIDNFENNKIELHVALYSIESILVDVKEANQDINEYWRVLDTLEWLD